jgi:hypothetical protein
VYVREIKFITLTSAYFFDLGNLTSIFLETSSLNVLNFGFIFEACILQPPESVRKISVLYRNRMKLSRKLITMLLRPAQAIVFNAGILKCKFWKFSSLYL